MGGWGLPGEKKSGIIEVLGDVLTFRTRFLEDGIGCPRLHTVWLGTKIVVMRSAKDRVGKCMLKRMLGVLSTFLVLSRFGFYITYSPFEDSIVKELDECGGEKVSNGEYSWLSRRRDIVVIWKSALI